MDSDPVWYRDVPTLVRRPLEFWPSRYQTPDERLNSVVRLVLYVSLATYAYKRRPKFLLFGLAAIAAASLAHRSSSSQKSPLAQPRRRRGILPDSSWSSSSSSSSWSPSPRSGSSTADGTRPHAVANRRVKDVLPAPQQCTLSTPDNPFANMLLTDLADNPGRPPACKYDQHKDLIRNNFNLGLVRNVYDVYEKENSQRQFMTMPVTTSTPDTVAFAQFCYGNAGRPTCKEDPSRCTGFFP